MVLDILRMVLLIPSPFALIFFVGFLVMGIGAIFSKDVRQLHFADGGWIFMLIVWVISAVIIFSEAYLITIA